VLTVDLSELRVLFSATPISGTPAKNIIALWPSTNDWNDFGRKLIFDSIFNIDGAPSFRMSLKLSFLGDSRNPEEVLKEKLSDRSGFIPKSNLPTFYTLLYSVQEYRNFVQHFGNRSTELLACINDLVALSKGKHLSWLSKVNADENYRLGLIRSNEAFFALHNAGDILDGLDAEEKSGFSETLEFTCSLPNFTSGHRITFHFDNNELSPKRIMVLIGENGVGKTQILAKIAKSLIFKDDAMTDPTSDFKRPSLTRLIALEAPRFGRSPFPARAALSSPITYTRLSLYRASAADGFGAMVIKLARSEESIAGKRRMDIFLAMVKKLENPSKLFIKGATISGWSLADLGEVHRYNEKDALNAYAAVDPKGRPAWASGDKYIDVSSGQGAFLRLAAQLCLLVERGTLLLIDEPETHLHPAYIQRLVSMLDELLLETGSAAIIATHSAYIVREVSNEQVRILRRHSDGTPEVTKPRLRTLGADVGAISFFVFGDELNGVLVDKIEARLSLVGQQRNAQIDSFSDELAPEAQAQLRRS
jgi:predicted ATPase